MKLELILEIFAHQKVYNELLNFIANCNVGDKIPSENVLATTFGITRATVRQGIARLKNEGLVYSRQGGGNYIAPQKINYTLSKNTTFSNEILKLGKTPSMKILDIETISPNSFLLEKFNIKENQSILKITLVRMVDDIPILLGYSYLNTALTPDIDLKIVSTTSFTKTFKEYGLNPTRNHSELEIISSDEKYMQMLQMQNTLPLIKIASTSIDKTIGKIIEHVESFFRSDLVKISIDFNRTKEAKRIKEPPSI